MQVHSTHLQGPHNILQVQVVMYQTLFFSPMSTFHGLQLCVILPLQFMFGILMKEKKSHNMLMCAKIKQQTGEIHSFSNTLPCKFSPAKKVKEL
jgi:hypothetical protein